MVKIIIYFTFTTYSNNNNQWGKNTLIEAENDTKTFLFKPSTLQLFRSMVMFQRYISIVTILEAGPASVT